MTYGDGSETITPLCTVDIAAHEITHGLTSYTCGLNYQNESGAINESFSDIFGTCVEHYAEQNTDSTTEDWLIGEDIGTTFRSMADPNAYNNPDTYLGEYWHTDASDNGGVHTNMSLLCYWFYLISEGGIGENDNGDLYDITGIGIDSAANIAFKMQTVYLTNTSELIDARFFGIQSAIDFYGACSSEVETITNAFHAVGLGGEYVPNVQAEFSADYTENCTTPFTVNFDNYSINGSTFTWDFGDGTTTSPDVNPSHTYTSMGNFDVSLYANGGTCGEDTLIITDFVSIDPSNPCMSFMPLDGDETINECYGTLFDSGGPDNVYSDNSDATFTIQPDGAGQIILNIIEFDIEAGSDEDCDYDYIAFYDGANTSSTLINDTYYCNTNGNPQTISSTGGAITIQFHSDAGSSLNGFQIDWECIQEDTPPTAQFSASSTNSCNGRIQFTNESINLPNTHLWEFGDGETSSEQNPAHVYQSSGTYSVNLTVSNDYGNDQEIKTDYININLAPAPTSENQTVCTDSTFTISASSENGGINWFTDENCTNWIYSGSSWDHTPISEALTYYIRSIIEADFQNVGEENNTTNGDFFGNSDYIHYQTFDAYQEFTLISVSVNAENEGNRSIALRDQYGNTIDATEVYCPAGVSRIDLNLSVPIGQNLQLVGLGSPDLYRTNVDSALNYPYTIENILSITGSDVTDSPLSYYYYFYDWEIQNSPCESETSIMQIDVEDCSVGISDEFSNKVTAYPNPVDSKIYFKGLNESDFPLEINITDCNGRKIITKTINEASFDISQFIPGLYLIQLNSDTLNYQTKIVKK
jgi:PKD repeat protein